MEYGRTETGCTALAVKELSVDRH